MLKSIILLAGAVMLVCAECEEPEELKAIVKIVGQKVQGNITFTQIVGGKTHVVGVLSGLPAGEYGFHVHEKGDITGGCASALGHFNPENKQHGSPSDENRHVGDLGNAFFNSEGQCNLDFEDHLIALYGPHNIIGRAVVLHEKTDDLGRSAHPDSKKTGNAGGRAACGVIGILDPVNSRCANGAGSIVFSATLMIISFTLTLF